MNSGPNFLDPSHSESIAADVDLIRTFGTNEVPRPRRPVHLGPLSFLYSDQAIRRISWHGIELVRAISWPVRDESWATYPSTILDEDITITEDAMAAHLQVAIDSGRLVMRVAIEASNKGEIAVTVTMAPTGGAFSTNRAGLTVLHPIAGLTGAPVRVSHTDGSVEEMAFPTRIMPSQPIQDIAGMSYRIGSASVDLAFEGEVFEVEDQRNWSDASFKTYCVPLKEPFTYRIETPLTQVLRIGFGGAPRPSTVDTPALAPRVETLPQTAPAIGLAIEDGWEGSGEIRAAIATCGASHLLVRITPKTQDTFLSSIAELATRLEVEVDVELVLDDRAPESSLVSASDRLASAGIVPRRVLALPKAYLKSYQPNATWPTGAAPSDIVDAARRVFPAANIGGGMLTNFTEFNRCRPDPSRCDYVSHGSSATVHASDDVSVIETLETLPHIFDSAEALRGQAAYRLGLVTIGMRSNPYGVSVSDNPEQTRATMTSADPRHRGLFGAAWAVGVLASTAGSAVEALCLAAPSGPFGLVATPTPPTPALTAGQPTPETGSCRLVPLYHVVRQARRLAGRPRVTWPGLPEGLAAYGATSDDVTTLMVANLTNRPGSVDLPGRATVSVLAADTFDDASGDANWLENTPKVNRSRVELGPFAVAFVRLEA